MISLLGLDPAAYCAHPLHDGERAYTETNCYTDLLIELVASWGLEPEAMLAGTVAVDFEWDQWTFFKPSPEDLLALYDLDVHEMQPNHHFVGQIVERLAAGLTTIAEVDAFWLPDTAATSYRCDHVKTSVVAEAIDLDAEVLRYFHNAGYYELSGDDFRGLFEVYGRSDPTVLPPYVEQVRRGPAALTGQAVRAGAAALLGHHLARRPTDNPFARFAVRLQADLPRLLEADIADYHAYAFANARMAGASFELLASHVRWLFGVEGESVAALLDEVVGGTKMLLFRLARRRSFDVAGVVGPMAEGWEQAMAQLETLVAGRLSRRPDERILQLDRAGPPVGDDADAVSHVYTTTVTLAAADIADSILHVGGVATSYDVVVNGVVVVAGRSMFARHHLAVGRLLREGENDIAVRVHPLTDLLDAAPRRPRARWRTMLTDEPRLRWARTCIWGRAPGFAPGPPIVGPWRPVVLETGAGPRVSELRLRTSVVDGAGVLDVKLLVSGATEVIVELDGPSGRATAVVPVVEGRGTCRLRLPEVERWWPHTHGDPVLHDVRVLHDDSALALPGDGTADSDVRRVGFRTVENHSPASVDLHINGARVFARGAVWTPGDLAALDEAVALGLNLVRVTGLMTYESDAFHARCDELGLLVWQDLMFVTYDYPLVDEDFGDQVGAEVAGELERLAPHPSTVVVCGSAEHEQQAAMFGAPADGRAQELGVLLEAVVAASEVDAIWVAGTPSGGSPPTRVDIGVAQYFGYGAYLRDLPDVRASRVGFAGECLAFANLPVDSCEPGEGVPRDNGATWDFADVREHYARVRYGADATPEQRRRVTGQVMAEVFGEWRRPDSGCGGGIVLWLRDLRPGAGWGLLDHAGAPKPAALELAPVLQPLAIWLVDEGFSGLDVHVAHDRPVKVHGTVRVELLREDETAIESAERSVSVIGRGHLVLGVEAVLGRFADASYAYRFGPAPHAAVRAVLVVEGQPDRTATWSVPRGAGPRHG